MTDIQPFTLAVTGRSINSRPTHPDLYRPWDRNFIFKSISQEEGRTFAKVRPINLRKLPIPNWNNNQISFISNLYEVILKDEILNSEKIDELNNFVYKLYELTYDEVRVIDPHFSLTEEEYNAISLE